jgi:hypothetical protein
MKWTIVEGVIESVGNDKRVPCHSLDIEKLVGKNCARWEGSQELQLFWIILFVSEFAAWPGISSNFVSYEPLVRNVGLVLSEGSIGIHCVLPEAQPILFWQPIVSTSLPPRVLSLLEFPSAAGLFQAELFCRSLSVEC